MDKQLKRTKEKIREEALKLFAERGYAGTSMSDIASKLNITKAALYKHYAGKQEILDSIVERMSQLDAEYARDYEMPEGTLQEMEEAYQNVPVEKIGVYTKSMFAYWTEESFSSDFRKMLTLEQYRDPQMGQLYQQYLAGGPLEYMTDIFRFMAESDEEARQLALQFYGPVFLLYSVYDQAEDKTEVIRMVDDHIEIFSRNLQNQFFEGMQEEYNNDGK